MPRRHDDSMGAQFAERFSDARRALARALQVGARDLPSISGLLPNGVATVPIENVLADATNILVDSEGVYVYNDSVAVEEGEGENTSLQFLTTGHELRKTAGALLANYFTCEVREENKSPAYFAPKRCFVETLLARAPTRSALRKISTYARHPIYDDDFVLCGPGYHAQRQVLVHGFDVEPVLPGDGGGYGGGGDRGRGGGWPIRDRLPLHIRTLLCGFCFKEDADVANALAALLTGALRNHFVHQPKATNTVDANQAGVGKTWFALATGAVLDGQPPDLIHYNNNDEELAKRVLSNLLQRPTSVLLFDNAKNRGGTEISSPCIEANSMAPNITLRILGKSMNYTQPNDVLWFITMNQTKLGPDLTTRGMPIRLFHEGDPAERVFDGPNPLDYALEHRAEILGELFGMVERWKSYGRPPGSRRHRCEYWAQVIGGILEACGFPEFLGNAAEAAAEFNTELGDLAALAEWVVRNGPTAAFTVVANQHSGNV